jgi:cell division protein FtsI/penicillin-binding protein 2
LVRSLPLVLVFVAIWFVRTLIAGYGEDLVKNREWVGHVEVPTLSALHATVFRRLVDNGLIWTERRPGFVLLHQTPCTSATMAAPENAPVHGTPTGNQIRQLIDLLCRSPQGQFIQDEIEAWNLSYELLAVRDNRSVNLFRPVTARQQPPRQRPDDAGAAAQVVVRRCATSAVLAHFFVPPHCYENAWQAVYVSGAVRLSASTSPNAEPPPRDFAFLATEGITYPGDWRTFAPFAGARERGEQAAPVSYYELSTDIPVGAEPVAIHVVGNVFDVRLGSGDWPPRLPSGTAPPRLAPQKLQASGLTIEVDLLCKSWLDSSDTKICLSQEARDENSAYQLTLTSPTGRSETVHVGIRVLPSLVPADELGDGAHDTQTIPLHRATNIQADCAGPHPKRQPAPAGRKAAEPGPCSLKWLDPHSLEQREETSAQVFMRTGDKSLIEPNGILTDSAFENGMADIVGLGPTTFGSLTQKLVGARNLSGLVKLTIDPELQRLTRDVLSENIRCNPRNRRANPAACDDATRGTVVVMDADAGPSGGEILAVATWPQMGRGLGAWDLAALDAGRPSDSPIAGNGWRAHDKSSMAGSTFKPVTAIAAIQRVIDSGDETLSAILLGTSPLADLERHLHIRRAEKEWPGHGSCKAVTPSPPGTGNVIPAMNDKGNVVRCIGNARKENAVPVLLPDNIVSYRNVCGGPARRFGLCEALAMSSNLYFGGLALYLDAPRFEGSPEPPQAMPDLALARMTRRLFPDGLGEGVSRDAHRHNFLLARGLLARGQPLNVMRLEASPFILPAEAARVAPTDGPRQLDLALNGVGQAVTATPVVMATVYASLGSRTIIRPTLVRLDTARGQRGDPLEGQPLLTVPPGRQEQYEQLMTQIQRGLNGVITEGTAACTGPAHCPFKWKENLPQEQLRNSIFLKTGTATLSDEGDDHAVYSAWIAGWVDPPRGIPSGVTGRVAIACHIARTRDSGGTACAPIVGALIRALHGRRR